MRVRESWLRATERMAEDVGDPELEAEVLLRHAAGMDRAGFFAGLEEQLAPALLEKVSRYVRRRIAGEPLAYLVGHREFYGLKLFVNSTVLVPRQETELLIDKVLENAGADRDLVIADVGTGSGAIAVALACNLPDATVYATDTSHEALRVADINRRRHGVAAPVHLRRGDLLGPVEAPVDVIVSNPPYLRTDELDALPAEVRREPVNALDGGPDGLDTIRRLVHEAPSHLRVGGRMLVEIAPQQLGPVLDLSRGAFPSARVSFARDLIGLPRVVIVRLP